MAIPRPKILTAITVPSGGWSWDIDLSDAAQYDTNITGTIAAGDYFMSGDQQSDDLIYAFMDGVNDEIDTAGINGYCVADIEPDTHKVRIQFYGLGFTDVFGDNDVRLNLDSWTAGLPEAFGFDSSAADTSTTDDYPLFTADYHHAYGWYSDEDGQLRGLRAVDVSSAYSLQGTSISGKVKTQFFGEQFANELSLQFLERNKGGRTKVYSDGVGYTETPVDPYNRNEPLECWWNQARKGVRFRVYRDGYVNLSRASARGVSTACDTTTLTNASVSMETEPQRFAGSLIRSGMGEISALFYVSSNTATVLTVANAHPTGQDVDGSTGGAAGRTYYIFDHRYETYVVDLAKMKEFDPEEIPAIDHFNIKIPLKRYV